MSLKPSGGGFRFEACRMAGMLDLFCRKGVSLKLKVVFEMLESFCVKSLCLFGMISLTEGANNAVCIIIRDLPTPYWGPHRGAD